jgi:hypothetical protein
MASGYALRGSCASATACRSLATASVTRSTCWVFQPDAGLPAEARLCYAETVESVAARAHARELQRLSSPGPQAARPDKRERRELIRQFKRRD